MKQMRRKIPRWAHIRIDIRLHKSLNSNAAILKGVAFFFRSTKFYASPYISNKYYSVLYTRAADSVSTRIFLFLQITGKPHDGRPRCRSPPFVY